VLVLATVGVVTAGGNIIDSITPASNKVVMGSSATYDVLISVHPANTSHYYQVSNVTGGSGLTFSSPSCSPANSSSNADLLVTIDTTAMPIGTSTLTFHVTQYSKDDCSTGGGDQDSITADLVVTSATGTVKIHKVVEGGSALPSDFSIGLNPGYQQEGLTESGPHRDGDVVTVVPGKYWLFEMPAPGLEYFEESLTCTSPDHDPFVEVPPPGSLASTEFGLNVTVAAGEVWDCTITNASPPLTITANSQTRAFGAADPEFTYGVSPAVSLTTPATCTSTATPSSGVGSYPITCSDADLAGYSISYVAGTLTITPAPLTVTADNKTRVFGAADPAFTYGVSPAVSLTTPATCTSTADGSSGVGTYPITCTGAAADNYTIGYVAGTLTITPAAPTVAPPTVAPPTVAPPTVAPPTVAPTATPSQSLLGATATPTVAPTATPTVAPTATPTVAPTATPTATQSQSLLGATSAPNATPPATSTLSRSSGDNGTPIFALLICLAFGSLAMLMVEKQRRTIRR